MRRLDMQTLANQSLVTALLVATWTADQERKLLLRVFANGVAGGGAYTAYATVQAEGAGSTYVSLPKTVAEAAAGETAIAFQSIPLAVNANDVVKVYLLGLAGDGSGINTRVEIHEDDGVDVALLSGDGNAASNLEAAFDGTGFADTFAPAQQQQITDLDGDVANLHANVALAVDLASLDAKVDAQETHQDAQDAEIAAIKAKTDLITAGRPLVIYPEGVGVWGDSWHRQSLL